MKITILVISLLFTASSFAQIRHACTPDINRWGNPSGCTCDKGKTYSPRLGSCLKSETNPTLSCNDGYIYNEVTELCKVDEASGPEEFEIEF